MTKTRKSRAVVPLLIVILIALCGAVGYMGYSIWCDSQTVFRDVTVELGTQALSIRDFMTDRAWAGRARFVSDPSTVDLSQVGTTRLTLRHGTKSYEVTLTVQDTTAPTATIDPTCALSVTQPIPEAATLVHDVQDAAQVKIYYDQEPQIPEDYSSTVATVVVEDASGNALRQACEFSFYGWLKEHCELELGQALTADMLLTNPEKDAALLDQAELDEISAAVGEHTLTVTSGSVQATCLVTVADTTGPDLQVCSVRRSPGVAAALEDFVVSASDPSGEPEVRLASELPDFSKTGTYTITIEAEDPCGNVTTQEATLWISTNMNPPKIIGATTPISMEKHTTPDFLSGVWASDDIDGKIEVSVDTSALDSDTAGTYFITYSATDSSGNVGTYKRKVVVESNEEDTAALVQEIADSLPNDPEAIRDYVRERIDYSHSWGGDDPVWHGFTTNTGNCYVHALCLKSLLDLKGYETQLIWVTNESHYWLIIHLDEGWRHIDSTPSAQHMKVSLMTDKDRYANLNGRNWDRSKWPACE